MEEICSPVLPLIGSLFALLLCQHELYHVSADLHRSDCSRVGDFLNVYKDHSLQSHIIQTLQLSHVIDCIVACMEHASCKSYNFQNTQDSVKICELSDSTKKESSTDFVSRSGYTYYDTGSTMQHGPNCHSSPCNNYESCFESCNPAGYRCAPYSVKFAKTTETVGESDVSVQVKVQITGLHSTPVTLQVNSKGITASASEDYSAVSSSITFLPSDVEKIVDVFILSDSKFEEDETFSLILSSEGSGETTESHVINITIIDDDASVDFAKTTETVSESGVSVQVQLQIAGFRSGPVTVQNPVLAKSLGTLDFNNAEYQRGSHSNNEDNEPPFPQAMFMLCLANGGSDQLEKRSGSLIRHPRLCEERHHPFSSVLLKQKCENNPLDRTGQERFLCVNVISFSWRLTRLDSNDITATSPNDYTAVSTSITFQRSDAVKSVDVLISSDTKIEADETFSLIITTSDSGLTTTNNIITITIMDDTVGTISMETATQQVLESVSTFKLGVLFPQDNLIPVSARVKVSSGTAAVDVDFALPGDALTFSPGSTREEISVSIVDDSLIEALDDETFTITLETTDSKLVVSSSDQTLVSIQDDDAPNSCKKVKDFGQSTGDGEYNLYLQRPSCNAPARVYCVNMNTNTPLEYVTLTAGRSTNYGFDNRRPGTYSDKHGKTAYDKIRLKLPDREVQIDDRRFAALVEGYVQQKYGRAANCRYSSSCNYAPITNGITKADLTGTDFKFPATIPYKVSSYPSCAKKMHSPSMSSDRKKWSVKCGGYCGGCEPSELILSVDAC